MPLPDFETLSPVEESKGPDFESLSEVIPEPSAAEKQRASLEGLSPTQILARSKMAYAPQVGRTMREGPLFPIPRVSADSPAFRAVLRGITGQEPTDEMATSAAAAVNVGKSLPEFLESPMGIVTAPAGGGALGPLASRLTALGFAGQMAASVPEAAREAGRVSVEGTPQEQKEALLGLGANIALPAALAAPALARRGMVRPVPEEIRPAPTPVATEAAPVAPTAAPTPLTAAEQAAERARLASELGEEPEPPAAAPAPTPEPTPVPETPVETTAPAKPESILNKFADKSAEEWFSYGQGVQKQSMGGQGPSLQIIAEQTALKLPDERVWQAELDRVRTDQKKLVEELQKDPSQMANRQTEIMGLAAKGQFFDEGLKIIRKQKAPEPISVSPTYTGPDAIEIVGKPLGEWFKAKTAADLPKRAQRVELAGRIRAKSTKPKDILGALKNEQDRIRRVVTEMAKPPLRPEEAIPMVQPTVHPTATETTPPVPAAEMPKTPTATGMRPAIRMVGGKVVVGDAGQTHPQIIRKNKIKAKEIDQRGFVDEQGNFHDREQTAAITGQPTEREPGRQHSTDLPEAKESPAPPTEPPPQAGPIGMGAAVSEEFEHDPRTPTGIRNAIVDKERVKRGLPEAMKAARRSFGEVWDRAMVLIDRDPTTQDELLNTLRDKPRALTDTEDALVLHRQIDLQNEYGKATRDLAQAFDDGRLDDVARERVRVASLADKLLDIYNIGKTSGTETARGLSTRRMMANEDFTLARMVTEKRAANQGKPLTDAQNAEIERLNKIIETTQKALDDFQKREAERRGGGPPPTTPPRIDPELERIKADNERAKREYRESLIRDRLKQRTPFEKTQDWIVKWRRAFVLSSPITLAKLTSAAVQRMTFTPIEELLGAGISKAIPSVAQRAAREGGINARAESKALTEGFTKGMRDSWDVLRTGRSSLDVLYGRAAGYPPGVSDFFGHVHGALKSVTKRNEFARAFEKRSAAAIAQGVDVSDPFVQSSIAVESYKDANRSIFQQDNRVITAYKAALRVLEQRAKDTGKTPAGAKAIATTGKILLPIVRIPTNIVAETLQYATGSVTGSARLGRAFARGIQNLDAAEADIIMRSLKKGSIGAAVLALGYLNADVIGGYYEPGKRKPQDVPFGRVRVYGYDIPSYLLHNPLLETLQIGATARRLAESKLSKKDMEAQGIGWATLGAGMGLLEEVPFLRETVELAKTFRAGERRQFLGELLKSLTVPQGVQWLAATQDVDQYGRPISRKPRTLAESVKTGIPGLREEVPVRPPPKRTP